MQNDPHRERRRFWRRVRPAADGCWLWVGGTRANGYGSFAVKTSAGRWTQTTAHRFAYTDQGGLIPVGYEVDHLCRVRACVRPEHLEAVTLLENRHRRDTRYAPEVARHPRPPPSIPAIPEPPPKRDRSTHCKNWHEYEVTGWVRNGPTTRTCAACRSIQNAARRTGGQHGTETHCPKGHPYSGANLYVRASGGRECRECTRTGNRERARRLAAAAPLTLERSAQRP